MKKSLLFKIVGYLILGFILLATILKLTHYPNSDAYLVFAAGGYFVFMIVVLYQVLSSRRINSTQKFLWVIGLFCLFIFAALFYLIAGYDKVVHEKQTLNFKTLS